MVVNLVLHVELNVPRHEDNGLPHKEQEESTDQIEHEHQRTEQEQAFAEDVVYKCLFVKALKKAVDLDVLGDEVKGMTYNLCGDDGKDVGNDNEEYAGDYPPFILIEILIEKTKVLHGCVKLCKGACFF